MSQTNNLFKEFSGVLIETGSATGDGITFALEAGMKRIISIEARKQYFDFCVEKFKDNPEVTIVLGESKDVLTEVLSTIEEPVTFWLDAHYCGDININGIQIRSFEGDCPLLRELEIIGQHHIKTHNILIDDLRIYGHMPLEGAIRNINHAYKIQYRDGTAVNDILMATV